MGELFGRRSRSRVVQLGLLALLVGSALFVLAVRASRLLGMAPIAPFSLPSPSIGVPLLPDATHLQSADSMKAWRRKLIRGLVHMVVVLAYYCGFATSALGVSSVVGALVFGRDRHELASAARRLAGDSVVQAAALASVLLWAVILNPWVWPIAVEVFIVLTVGGAVFAVLSTLTLEVYRREGTVLQVFVAYPLAMGTLVLPLIAAGLASPTFARLLQDVTVALAVFLLDNVLAVVGLSTFLRQQFRLAGIAYFATWVGVIVVVGWLLGGLAIASRRLRERGML